MKINPHAPWKAAWFPVKVFLGLGMGSVLFLGGYFSGKEALLVPSSDEQGIFGQNITIPADIADDVDFRKFWQVWNLVRETYVDQPVADEALFTGALQGLVFGLNDPYSSYFTEEMAQEFSQELSGSFFGIGAELGMNAQNELVVVAPIAGTPAEKAGVRAGDRILSIDGVDTFGMEVTEAVGKIRGEEGTPVALVLLGLEEEASRTVTITREEIHIESVVAEVRPDGIGVITVSVFGDDTLEGFARAAKTMEKANVSGLIIDMRNNPGGYLEGALGLAGYWTGDRVVVKEQARDEETALFSEWGDARFASIPTVILVNGGSASASEIFAGALQEYDLAHIIGTTTFGKGTVQEYHELPDGAAVKITVARWLTPGGTSFDGVGIVPDETVERTLDDMHAQRDPQFDAAIRFLTTK